MNEYVLLEAATPDLLEFGNLMWWNLSIDEAQTSKIQFDVFIPVLTLLRLWYNSGRPGRDMYTVAIPQQHRSRRLGTPKHFETRIWPFS